MKNLAPIVLFVYNRLDHTIQTIEALQKNELANESELFIYCDESKNDDGRKSVNEVRKYIDSIEGFKKINIIKREKNWGLANSVIDGVTTIINKYERVIVLEDDLVTSPYFLNYMNNALNIYESRKDIFSISGYNYPGDILPIPNTYNDDTYLSYRSMSWGWATWKEKWDLSIWDTLSIKKELINIDTVKKFNRGGSDLLIMLKNQLSGKMDSWAIRFTFTHTLNDAYCLYPINSYIRNIGIDGSGTHSSDFNDKNVKELNINKSLNLNDNIGVNQQILDDFYLITKDNFIMKLKRKIRSLF